MSDGSSRILRDDPSPFRGELLDLSGTGGSLHEQQIRRDELVVIDIGVIAQADSPLSINMPSCPDLLFLNAQRAAQPTSRPNAPAPCRSLDLGIAQVR